jgi:hypothetical protein
VSAEGARRRRPARPVVPRARHPLAGIAVMVAAGAGAVFAPFIAFFALAGALLLPSPPHGGAARRRAVLPRAARPAQCSPG